VIIDAIVKHFLKKLVTRSIEIKLYDYGYVLNITAKKEALHNEHLSKDNELV